MAAAVWEDRRVTIVVLPESDLADRLLDLAETWVKSWLLLPALWVKPGGVSLATSANSTSAPPTIEALVIGRNGRRSVDLFDRGVLGRDHLKAVRILSVQDPNGPKSGHTDTAPLITALKDHVLVAAPVGGDTADGKTEVLTFNLVFGASNLKTGSAEALMQISWDANFVVSTEDRAAPNRMDSFTRLENQGRMDGFVLGNIASVGGLWSGNPMSIFDVGDRPERAGGRPTVRLMRSYVRAVMSEGMSLRVAARALTKVGGSESPLQDNAVLHAGPSGLGLLDQKQARAAIDSAVTGTLRLQDGQLAFQNPPHPDQFQPFRRGLRETILNFIRFAWSAVRGLAPALARSVKRRINRKGTEVFYGVDGLAVVDVNIDLASSSVDEVLDFAYEQVLAIKKSIEAETAKPMESVRRVSNPVLWRDVRQVLFRMLDGTSAPEAVEANMPRTDTGKLLVVPDVRLIMPDPADTIAARMESTGVDSVVVESVTDALEKKLGFNIQQPQGDWLDVTVAKQVIDAFTGLTLEAEQELTRSLEDLALLQDEFDKTVRTKEELEAQIKGDTRSSFSSRVDAVLDKARTLRQWHGES